MWSMLASPLLLGCDLTKIDSFTMSLITNDDIIALNQDRLGKQAEFLYEKEHIQVWRKLLSDGTFAIAVINLNSTETTTPLNLDKVTNMKFTSAKNLWTKNTVLIHENKIPISIQAHGIAQFKLNK